MEKKNNESRAVALLKEKLESNLRDYRNDWLTLPKEELIDRAEEVYSVCVIAAFLPKTVSEEQAEYLLQFRNPLEVVNDEWLGRNSFDEMIEYGDQLGDAITHIVDSGYAEECYDLEPELLSGNLQM